MRDIIIKIFGGSSDFMNKNETERDEKVKQDAENAVKAMFKLCLRAIELFFNIFVTLLLVLIIAGFIVVCAFALYISQNIDADVSDIVAVGSDQNSVTSIYYYDENEELVEDVSQRLSSGKNIMWVSYSDIPEDLVNAFVAIEDKRFFDHNGVDWITTIRATLKYFIPMGSQAGGSTITQQVIKNVTGDDDYSIQRKVTEIFKAMNLQKSMSKEQIMELYLNIIYLSQGANGVQAAANVYFSKDVSELSLIECAAIAGITQYPTKWDPIQNPENNKYRRNVILVEMLDQGYITQAEFDEAYDTELELNVSYESISLGTTSWYTDAVIDESIELIAEKYNVSQTIAKQMLYSGGYEIVTAMDPEIQAILEKYYVDVSDTSILPTSEVIMPESSMIVADPYTGDILGLVGGRGEKTQSRIFNRATAAKRQSGSSIKPVAVYAPALEYGVINAGTVLDDTPFNFGTESVSSTGTKTYSSPSGWPQNSNRRYQGRMTTDYAITASKNAFAVKVLDLVGIERSYSFLTEKLHFDSLKEAAASNNGVSPDKNYATLALGGFTYGVTLKEMCASYTIFPTGGIFTELRTVVEIRDSNGNVVIDNSPVKEIVMSEAAAQAMTKMLQHVITDSHGTAYSYMSNIRKLMDFAGKTGTTDANNDRWFIGYSPYFVCGDWIGYDEPQSLESVVKNGEHCRVWATVMYDIHQKFIQEAAEGKTALKTFDDSQLIKATFCADSGKLITDACNCDPRGSRAETAYFTKDTLPSEACDIHVMVRYCTEGHGVACSACPEESCTYVGLIHVERSFPRDIYVTDAEFTWRELPEDVTPYISNRYPFYFRLYVPSSTYSGRTSSPVGGTGYQYNRACPLHR